MHQAEMGELEQKIGYFFRNPSILTEALTHSSYANESKAKKKDVQCNERLEFLGDSILAAVVSEYLFCTYPNLPEGELTLRRKAVVQSSALASYARKIELGKYLFLGNGEEKGNGRERQSTLENAFEALIAAMYLDAEAHGYASVRAFVLPFVKEELATNYNQVSVDPKTELQQLIQQTEGDCLEYLTVGEHGPDHEKVFEVEARLNSNIIGRGTGHSKREAEQNAAKEALRLFGEL